MSLKPRAVDFQETWNALQDTMRRVVSLQPVDRAVWGRCFSMVYSLCVAQPEPLSDRLYTETRTFVEKHVRGLLRQVSGVDEDHIPADDKLESTDPDDGLLARYADAWAEFRQGATNLNSMFSYLNMQFVNLHKPSDAEIIYGSAASVEGGDGFDEGIIGDRASGEDARRLEIGELCLAAWERLLLRPLAPQLTVRLVSALGEARRDPPQADSERARLVRELVSSAVEARTGRAEHLALYEEVALKPYLEAARVEHERAAQELLADGDVAHYMQHALDGLHRELRLAETFLHESSRDTVRGCYERAAVAPHLAELHAHAEPLLRAAAAASSDCNERRDDLRRMFALLQPLGVSALRPLVDAAYAHVAREGASMLERAPADDAHTHFVESVLALQRKYARLFADVFDGDQAFLAALDRACSASVNARPESHMQPRAPDLLSRYCDSLLRKRPANSSGGAAQLTEAETEEKLSAAIVVFKYVDDKDYFQKYYARALAKRLIQQASASMEQEEAMINRLKAACGYEFTNKLHRMFTDVTLSTDLNAKFQQHVRSEAAKTETGSSAHLYVQVLQAGAWPLAGAHAQHGASLPPPLPAPLERPARLFEQFYRSSFSGRRLAWLQHLCTGELRTRYTPRLYHITATATQCAMLLSFETADEWNARELRDLLQLPQEVWVRAARPAIDAGLLLLADDSDPPDLNEDSGNATLRLNTAFSSKRTKLRLACAPPAANQGAGGPGGAAAAGSGTNSTHADCDDDRKMFLQAAIVRVMKRRKVCAHNDLLQEVLVAARGAFSPSVALVKKCIEALIDKQYLERAPGQHDTYNYLA